MTAKFTYYQFKNNIERFYLIDKDPTVHKLFTLMAGKVPKKLIKEYLEKWKEEDLPKIQNNNDGPQDYQKIAEELQYSLSLVRATMDSTADAILLIDKDGKLLDWNAKFSEITRIPQEVLEQASEDEGVNFIFTQLKDPGKLAVELMRLAKEESTKGMYSEVESRDGRTIERYTQPLILNGKNEGRVWSFRDITERKKNEEKILLRDRAIQSSPIGTIIINNDDDLTIEYANKAVSDIYGYNIEEMGNKCLRDLFHDIEDQEPLDKLYEAIKAQEPVSVIAKTKRKNYKLFWGEIHLAPVKNKENIVKNFVILINDITDRKTMQEQLYYLASHDSLTGLPNRRTFLSQLKDHIEEAKRYQTSFSVWFIDLDNFKVINDSLGHNIGDKILQNLAYRLKTTIRASDKLARIGGDELIILSGDENDRNGYSSLIKRLLNTIKKPLKVGNHQFNLAASVGVSIYPHDGFDADTLIKNADTAMYYTKANGRNGFSFFDPEMNRKVEQKMKISNLIYSAIEKNELALHYQPIVDSKTHKVVSLEALLRWKNEEMGGFIPPQEFIPIVEETSAIHKVGNWVIRESAKQCKLWRDKLNVDLKISVNLSGKQFYSKEINKTINEALHENTLPPEALTMEITESILMEKNDQINFAVQKLHKDNIRLSLDDFGTGYSSLAYLKDLPISYLKIDRSFVQHIKSDKNSRAIISSIIILAKNLDIQTIAEGVEEKEELDFLAINNCDYIQGYYFSKPLPALECEAFLIKNIDQNTNSIEQNY